MPPTAPPVADARPETVPVVIGCGNEHRRDDACGLAAARLLRPVLEGRARVLECDGEATRLIDLWDGRGLVVVVDALQSGNPPGTVQRIEVGTEPLPAPLGATSTHGLSLAQGVALGRSLGRFPRRLVIYGIEAGDLEMGSGMTPAVSRGVDEVVARVELELRAPREPRAHA
ncbi:MAG TPA: hydrogenase maturation protease [Thermoplasmata archaeon]|nr:hydrogenase maturation protease [Thermoplasmata archaeon]